MSNPQPSKLKKKPARAEPLQPDRPARGDAPAAETQAATDEASVARRSAKRQAEQTATALENVTKGYD